MITLFLRFEGEPISWREPFLSPGPCNPNPCKNDGQCEVVAPTRRGDVFNEYICKCQTGFEGVHCQISRLLLIVINQSKLLALNSSFVQHYIYIYFTEHSVYDTISLNYMKRYKAIMLTSQSGSSLFSSFLLTWENRRFLKWERCTVLPTVS